MIKQKKEECIFKNYVRLSLSTAILRIKINRKILNILALREIHIARFISGGFSGFDKKMVKLYNLFQEFPLCTFKNHIENWQVYVLMLC